MNVSIRTASAVSFSHKFSFLRRPWGLVAQITCVLIHHVHTPAGCTGACSKSPLPRKTGRISPKTTNRKEEIPRQHTPTLPPSLQSPTRHRHTAGPPLHVLALHPCPPTVAFLPLQSLCCSIPGTMRLPPQIRPFGVRPPAPPSAL